MNKAIISMNKAIISRNKGMEFVEIKSYFMATNLLTSIINKQQKVRRR